MMNKKGGAGKVRVKGGMAGMFDFNAADIPDFAPEPVAPAQPASGKADLFSLFGGPAANKNEPAPAQSDSEDEDDLAAALAKKLGGLGDSDSKKSDSDDEDDKSSGDAESETDEKDDLLASLNALSGGNNEDKDSNDDEEDSDNASDDGDKDDLLASLNALGGGAADEEDGDASKNDLLASLNALNFGGDAEHESGSDNESEEGSEAADSDDAASEHGEDSSDSPLLKQHGSHGDINTSGLKRAKKTVQMKGLNKGGASYQMEDVWICVHPYDGSNDRALFCVFDGHAGKDAAAAASEKFPPIFADLVDDAVTDDDNPTFAEELKKAFLQTDEEMKDYEYEGTTATTVYLWRQGGSRFVQSANVGDSSSVLVRDGVATMISVDHRPSSTSEVERIKAMGIPMNPGQTRLNGLAVSRALGDHFPKSVECGIIAEPYVSPAFKLDSTHSHLIVASDGVWDVVSPQRAYDLIKDEEDADKAAQTLIKTVTKSAKCTDNVSCIVVRL
jgi:serine/threonine protein phosphatase PrpC